jgi:hypothetical protein
MSGPISAGISVIPNTSFVTGKLIQIADEADGLGELWDVEVQKAADIDGQANFVASEAGKVISVYLHKERISKSLTAFKVNDIVELSVEYSGDENGGRFVASGDPPRKIG